MNKHRLLSITTTKWDSHGQPIQATVACECLDWSRQVTVLSEDSCMLHGTAIALHRDEHAEKRHLTLVPALV